MLQAPITAALMVAPDARTPETAGPRRLSASDPSLVDQPIPVGERPRADRCSAGFGQPARRSSQTAYAINAARSPAPAHRRARPRRVRAVEDLGTSAPEYRADEHHEGEIRHHDPVLRATGDRSTAAADTGSAYTATTTRPTNSRSRGKAAMLRGTCPSLHERRHTPSRRFDSDPRPVEPGVEPLPHARRRRSPRGTSRP